MSGQFAFRDQGSDAAFTHAKFLSGLLCGEESHTTIIAVTIYSVNGLLWLTEYTVHGIFCLKGGYMAARRTGQIIQKGKDKWLVKVFRGRDAQGRKQYHCRQITGPKAAAQRYLTAKQRQRDLGVVIETARQTLNEHVDMWLSIIKSRVSEQTYTSYETSLRVHVRPRIGNIRLSGIGIKDVQGIVSSMEIEGRSPRTIRYAHAVLGMAFRKAMELDLIVKNPCDFVELPKQVKRETRVMSATQASRFLAAAEADRLGIVFEFALITGMRPEEYLGLTWGDVDLERSSVTVRKALVWLKGGYRLSEPKTARSRRTIPIPVELSYKLGQYRRKCLERKMSLGTAFSDLNLVFSTEIGTPIHYRNLSQRHFEKIIKAAGLEKEGLVLYSLRHTCATLLLAAGENPKVVSERLGHSTVKMTLDTYCHVLPDMQRDASERLGRILYG